MRYLGVVIGVSMLAVASACASGGSAIAAADMPHMLAERGIEFNDVRQPYANGDGRHMVGIDVEPNCMFIVVWTGWNFVVQAVSVQEMPIEMIEPEVISEANADEQLDARCRELQ